MYKPKVSIIIPVYNGDNYLKETIDNALKQTYSNIEIIVVDDGSVDKTEKIAKSYKEQIKYIKKLNGGVSSALNLGIKNMEGEYFSWLSHDDLYYPTKIEKEIEYLNNNNLIGKKVILYSDYDIVDRKSKLIKTVRLDHNELIKKPIYAILKGCINGLSLLIPKKAFFDCGYFNESLVAVQDYDLWFKMIKKYKFIHLSEVLVSTRYHSKQVSNQSPKVETEGNEFWIYMLDNLSKKDIKKLETTEEMFYYKMIEFLHQTPYKKAKEYANKKYQKLTGKLILDSELKIEENDFYSKNKIKRAFQIVRFEGMKNLLNRTKNKLLKGMRK